MKINNELKDKLIKIMRSKKELDLLDIQSVIKLANESNDQDILNEANEWVVSHCFRMNDFYEYVTRVEKLTEEDINHILIKAFSASWNNLNDMAKFLKVRGCPKELLYRVVIDFGENRFDALICLEEAIKDGVSENIIKELTSKYFYCIKMHSEEFFNSGFWVCNELIKVYNLRSNDSYNICKMIFDIFGYRANMNYFTALIDRCPQSMIYEMINIIQKENLYYLKFGIILLVNHKCDDEEKLIIYETCLRHKEVNYIIKYENYFGVLGSKIAEDLINIADEIDESFDYYYLHYYKQFSPEVKRKTVDLYLKRKKYRYLFEEPLLSTIDPQILLDLLPLMSDKYAFKILLFDDKSPFKNNKELKNKVLSILLNRKPFDVITIEDILSSGKVDDSFWEELANKLINSDKNVDNLYENIINFMTLHPSVKNEELKNKLNSLKDIDKDYVGIKDHLKLGVSTAYFYPEVFDKAIENHSITNVIFSYSRHSLQLLLKHMTKDIEKYALVIQVYYDFIIQLIYDPGISTEMLAKCQLLDQKYIAELRKLELEKQIEQETINQINALLNEKEENKISKKEVPAKVKTLIDKYVWNNNDIPQY